MSTEAQIAANQANAMHSTGPTTDAGKAKSSLNAVKSGLTGRTVLMPTEDASLYEAHVSQLTAFYAPVGSQEQALVQSIADAEWRLDRIPALEYGIFALGQIEFAPLFVDQPEALRAGLVQAKTFLQYQRQINNLAIQAHRIRRNREKDLAALKELRAARAESRNKKLTEAAHSLIKSFAEGAQAGWNAQELGFDFALPEVCARAKQLKADLFDALRIEKAARAISQEKAA
jgi:hypothetical protein